MTAVRNTLARNGHVAAQEILTLVRRVSVAYGTDSGGDPFNNRR
ncbi:MAG: hypothetical protein JWM17_499, partial [Actinobacteria bacterium]|nr:hypothetical protein [Actinomycetota bacterium]